jgi:hypothetical protein
MIVSITDQVLIVCPTVRPKYSLPARSRPGTDDWRQERMKLRQRNRQYNGGDAARRSGSGQDGHHTAPFRRCQRCSASSGNDGTSRRSDRNVGTRAS